LESGIDSRVSFLTDIFAKITDPTSTTSAIQSLHSFLQNNPDFNIHPYLARTSENFQSFVMNSLKQLDQNQQQLENRGILFFIHFCFFYLFNSCFFFSVKKKIFFRSKFINTRTNG